MQRSFIDLLKEIKDLERGFAFREATYPEIIAILRAELERRVPRPIRKMGLKPYEAAFMATIALNADPYENMLPIFLRFWSPKGKDYLQVHSAILESVLTGRLKGLVHQEDRAWILSPKVRARFLRLIAEDSKS